LECVHDIQNGNSVLLHVSSFLPYLYVAAPRGFTNDDCRDFSNSLNVRLAASTSRHQSPEA
jgi:DNA polymerase delta subunit 1